MQNHIQSHLYAFRSACKFSEDNLCASIALNLVGNNILLHIQSLEAIYAEIKTEMEQSRR